ncbi:hypothetical protein LWI29_012130 [Acer saccharum]|uniref:Uncharacterized protein n=1 Tax=Acer saccharum TaxID=4024 RepID=A0AA39RJ64_ACESA|nr:hypothetical protein LWI29_012130 [Acer saccharum]
MLTHLSTLMRTSQEGTTIAKYMQHIKTIVDDLALIGYPLSDAKIVVHTLHGLSNDYKELNASIRTRETTMTFEKLHDKILDHETRKDNEHDEGGDARFAKEGGRAAMRRSDVMDTTLTDGDDSARRRRGC